MSSSFYRIGGGGSIKFTAKQIVVTGGEVSVNGQPVKRAAFVPGSDVEIWGKISVEYGKGCSIGSLSTKGDAAVVGLTFRKHNV